MSKGSTRRPNFVPLAELAARWDATFGGRASVHELRTTTPMPDYITEFVDIRGGFATPPLPSDPDEQA